MTRTLDYLKNIAKEHGSAIALHENDVQVSYEELAVAVNALAVALHMKDPTPASRVALCAVNSLEYLVSVLAIQAADKVVVPLDPQADLEILHSLLEASLPSTLIVDDHGDAKIQCDEDFKIRFSQFEGLVRTYRDHSLPLPL